MPRAGSSEQAVVLRATDKAVPDAARATLPALKPDGEAASGSQNPPADAEAPPEVGSSAPAPAQPKPTRIVPDVTPAQPGDQPMPRVGSSEQALLLRATDRPASDLGQGRAAPGPGANASQPELPLAPASSAIARTGQQAAAGAPVDGAASVVKTPVTVPVVRPSLNPVLSRPDAGLQEQVVAPPVMPLPTSQARPALQITPVVEGLSPLPRVEPAATEARIAPDEVLLTLTLPSAEPPRSHAAAAPVAPGPQPSSPNVPQIVQTVLSSGDSKVEMVMNPEELGRLRFEVTQAGEQMRITLTVERPETLDMLRRHGDQLLTEFRQAGYSGATLSFGQWGQGGQQDAPPPVTRRPDQDARDAPPPAHSPATAGPDPRGTGLDLRL